VGWQYIFYLNVPIGAAALALAPRIVPDSRLATTRRRFDALGAITGTGGLVLLVDAIAQAPQYGWGATRTIALLAASVVLLVAFLVIESRTEEPLLPPSIFRLRTLAGANAAGLLLGGSFFAFIFVGTLYMQQVLHYSALQTGLAWLAASLTSIALADISQALVTRGGAKVVMAIGMTLIGMGVLWATQVPLRGHFLANLAGPFAVTGAGTAFAFIPISIAALAGVSAHKPGSRPAPEHQPAARRSDRDRNRLERGREPHPDADARRQRRTRGPHRRLPAGALGARRDRAARHPGDLRARPPRRAHQRRCRERRARARRL
jgi:Na+/melibiose symporter-like transporter